MALQPLTHGIDVSSAQGLIAWTKVVRARIPTGERLDFAWCKCSMGNQTPDAFFVSNWAGIAAVELVRGAYHFADPDTVHVNDPLEEATFFCGRVTAQGFRRGVDFMVLDIEEARKIHAGPDFARWVLTFCQTVVALTGARPMIYTGKFFWQDETRGCADIDTLRLLGDFPLILAAYVRLDAADRFVPGIWRQWTILQWSGDVAPEDTKVLSVDGVGDGKTTHVDHDVFRGTVDELRAVIAALVVEPQQILTLPPPAAHDTLRPAEDASAHPLGAADRAEADLAALALADDVPTRPDSPSSLSQQLRAALAGKPDDA